MITSKCVECIFIYQAYWQLIMSYHAIQHNTVWNIVDQGEIQMGGQKYSHAHISL